MLVRKPLLLGCLVAVGMAAGACGTGPKLELPSPGPEHYSSLNPVAIHAVSHREMVVTGTLTRNDGVPEGLILTSQTGGLKWHRCAVEVHDLKHLNFQTLFFSDRLRGWVGGLRVDGRGRTRPVIFLTEDAGNHWREVPLLQDPEVTVTAIHSLAFTSDSEGSVACTLRDPDSGETRGTTYATLDGGLTWVVESFREPPSVPFQAQTRSMVDQQSGFRLRRSPYPGVTFVEATASEGRDWMPVSELSVSGLATYY